ncbi:hypothetical protein C0992_010903 [Termitomyces sp. T32_za158]|nr:hypothetical protein C0992_010903 [Termitomyces sp. T32_za158]
MASNVSNMPTHPLEDHAWKSDYTLSESSEVELHSLLEKLRDAQTQHEAIITGVLANLDQLLNERQRQVMRINKLESALAPYKKLPPELLVRIFKECSPTPLKLPPDITSDRHNRPHVTIPSTPTNRSSWSIFSIMAVCSWWREIVLNSRDLWDDIFIRYPEFPSLLHWLEESGYMTEKSQEIISRGARSIAIFVHGNILLPEAIDPLHNLIIPFSHQFTHINLMSSMRYLFGFLRTSSPSFPVLESLTLKSEGSRLSDRPEHEFSSDLEVFKDAPKLRAFQMRDFSLDLAPLPLSQIQLPWDQLTKVDFRDTQLDVNTAHWLLSQCASAVSCWLSLSPIFRNTHIAALNTIVQTHLQSLSITNTSEGPSAAVVFFESLTLPSLCSFEITDFRFKDSLPGFLSLVSRSHCTLINLSVLEAQIPAMLLDPLLELVPALEDLNVPKTIISVPTLEHIAQGVLLPKLTKMACTIQSSPLSLDSFMNAVERTGASESEVTRLRIAIAVFPQNEGHYTATRWPQAIQRFKNLAKKLRDEGRSISLPEFRGLSFGSSSTYRLA